MTTARMIEYASWIRERVTDTELSNDLEEVTAWLLSSGVAKYKLDENHRITLCVDDWPLLTILAQNSTRIINGQRRFLSEFTRLATELGHTVKIRLIKRKNLDPLIRNAPTNLKKSKLLLFSGYDTKEKDHLERLISEDNASEVDKWQHYCYCYMDYFKLSWVDEGFLKEWGTELSCSRRTIFLGLLRPFDNLHASGHFEKDSLIAKVADIIEVTNLMGFDHFMDYHKRFEMNLELLSTASFFRNYKESRLLWGLESNSGPKEGVSWNRKQTVAAVTAMFSRCGLVLESTEGKRIKGVRQYTYHLTKDSVQNMMELCKLQLQGLEGEYKSYNWVDTINEPYQQEMKDLPLTKYGKYLLAKTETINEKTGVVDESEYEYDYEKETSEEEQETISTALRCSSLDD